MRLFILALTLFFLNLSVVMVDTLGIYEFNVASDSLWRDDLEGIKSKQFDPDVAADVAVSFGFGDFVSGFKNFVDILFRAVNLGTTLKTFGLTNGPNCSNCDVISDLFGFGGLIIYLLGLSQFISNRGTKGMG
ncbi:hypothetical protein LCGC14_2564140 [marine sediment metagenome]|uniref:Uncharacterized protein n=1 Tax=marine sediment metagenome TaxID=412755 RepID=A0A0F9AJL6_9ZZZZ